MGDVAEMMLDGTLCQQCGSFIDGETPGYPRYCEDCAKEGIERDIQEVEYDFNFNLVGVEQLAKQVMNQGTVKQKKAIIKLCYKLIGLLKKNVEDSKMNKESQNV